MNIGIRLIASLLLLSTSSAIASEHKPVLVGYTEIPSIHEPMWFELMENGGSRQKGDTSEITLYSTPNDWYSAVLVIDDFSSLNSEYIGHYDSLKAKVYGKVPGWYQLKTIDEQLLWIPENSTRNFISYLDALGHLVFSPPPGLLLSVSPSDDAELVEPHEDFLEMESFLVLEHRIVNGEIWLLLKHEWYVLIHEGSGVSPDDERFNYTGWVKAHRPNGEATFLSLGPMC